MLTEKGNLSRLVLNNFLFAITKINFQYINNKFAVIVKKLLYLGIPYVLGSNDNNVLQGR